METLVKMSGVPEDVLNILIGNGYFKTKSEAIRAGILQLGKEYDVLKNPSEMEKELIALKIIKEEKELKKKKLKNLSEEEVKEKYGFK